MTRLFPFENDSGIIIGYMFECPGCGWLHATFVRPYKNSVGASWEFNGDMDEPTFTPSILLKDEHSSLVCHCFVTAGRIRFLSDCTHELAGQEVELPEID